MESDRSSIDGLYREGQSSTPSKKPKKANWKILGIALFVVLVIIALVLALVLGLRKKSNGGSSGATPGSSGVPGSASSAVSAKLALGRFATATDSEFMVPLYPSTVGPYALFFLFLIF